MIFVQITRTTVEVGGIVIERTEMSVEMGMALPDELPFVPLYPTVTDPRRIGGIGGAKRLDEMVSAQFAYLAELQQPYCSVIFAYWWVNVMAEVTLARRLINRTVGVQRLIRTGALIEGMQEFEIREPVAYIAA